MKKSLISITLLGIALTLFNCKPDPESLAAAKQEGIRLGYDSARKIMNDSIDSFFRSLNQGPCKLPEDKRHYPPDDGHVHDPQQFINVRTSTAGTRTGVLAQICDSKHQTVDYYIPFIIPSHLNMVSGTDYYGHDLNSHTHLEYDTVHVPILHGSQQVYSIKVAVVKKIKPHDDHKKKK